MTPTESITALNAAIAAQQAAAKAVHAAEKAACIAHEQDWIARARTIYPAPDGHHEDVRTNYDGYGGGQTLRTVTALDSTTPAGSLRLRHHRQRIVPGSMHGVDKWCAAYRADPCAVRVEDETINARSRDAADWRERFGVKP